MASATTAIDLGICGLGQHHDGEIGEITQAELDIGRLERRAGRDRRQIRAAQVLVILGTVLSIASGATVSSGVARAGIAQQRDVADAAAGQIENDGVGGRVVAGLPDQLDGSGRARPRQVRRARRSHLRQARHRQAGRWETR